MAIEGLQEIIDQQQQQRETLSQKTQPGGNTESMEILKLIFEYIKSSNNEMKEFIKKIKDEQEEIKSDIKIIKDRLEDE